MGRGGAMGTDGWVGGFTLGTKVPIRQGKARQGKLQTTTTSLPPGLPVAARKVTHLTSRLVAEKNGAARSGSPPKTNPARSRIGPHTVTMHTKGVPSLLGLWCCGAKCPRIWILCVLPTPSTLYRSALLRYTPSQLLPNGCLSILHVRILNHITTYAAHLRRSLWILWLPPPGSCAMDILASTCLML